MQCPAVPPKAPLFQPAAPLVASVATHSRYAHLWARDTERQRTLHVVDSARAQMYRMLMDARTQSKDVDEQALVHWHQLTACSMKYAQAWMPLAKMLCERGSQAFCPPEVRDPSWKSTLEGMRFAWRGSASLHYVAELQEHERHYAQEGAGTSVRYESVMALSVACMCNLNLCSIYEQRADFKLARECAERALSFARVAVDERRLYSTAFEGVGMLADMDMLNLVGLFFLSCARACNVLAWQALGAVPVCQSALECATVLAQFYRNLGNMHHGVHVYATHALNAFLPRLCAHALTRANTFAQVLRVESLTNALLMHSKVYALTNVHGAQQFLPVQMAQGARALHASVVMRMYNETAKARPKELVALDVLPDTQPFVAPDGFMGTRPEWMQHRAHARDVAMGLLEYAPMAMRRAYDALAECMGEHRLEPVKQRWAQQAASLRETLDFLQAEQMDDAREFSAEHIACNPVPLIHELSRLSLPFEMDESRLHELVYNTRVALGVLKRPAYDDDHGNIRMCAQINVNELPAFGDAVEPREPSPVEQGHEEPMLPDIELDFESLDMHEDAHEPAVEQRQEQEPQEQTFEMVYDNEPEDLLFDILDALPQVPNTPLLDDLPDVPQSALEQEETLTN